MYRAVQLLLLLNCVIALHAKKSSSRLTSSAGWGLASGSSHPLYNDDTTRINLNQSTRNSEVFLLLRGGKIDDYEDDYDSDSSDYSDDETDDETDVDDIENDNDSSDDTDDDDSDSDGGFLGTDTEDEYDSDVNSDDGDTTDDDEEEMSKSVATPSSSKTKEVDEKVYDEPLAVSPMQDMGITLGVMVLCKKLDLTQPKIIKMARFAFIGYVILTQAFLLYVRFQAHRINDRTKINIKNPLSDLLQSQMASKDDSGTGGMVKSIASSFLANESTVLEYDLSQAKSMSTSVLFPMIMLYFLHFRMGQVQPLFFQTATGLKALFTSSLFQVYVLGRNLERPFTMKQSPLLSPPEEGDEVQVGEEDEDEDEDKKDSSKKVVDEDEEEDDKEDDDESDHDSDDESDDEYYSSSDDETDTDTDEDSEFD